jgi:hypothetical protein
VDDKGRQQLMEGTLPPFFFDDEPREPTPPPTPRAPEPEPEPEPEPVSPRGYVPRELVVTVMTLVTSPGISAEQLEHAIAERAAGGWEPAAQLHRGETPLHLVRDCPPRRAAAPPPRPRPACPCRRTGPAPA